MYHTQFVQYFNIVLCNNLTYNKPWIIIINIFNNVTAYSAFRISWKEIQWDDATAFVEIKICFVKRAFRK